MVCCFQRKDEHASGPWTHYCRLFLKISNSLTYVPDLIATVLCDALHLTHFRPRDFGEEISDTAPVQRLQLHGLILCNKGTLDRETILIYLVTVSNLISYFPVILLD